jgi:hypothetical protein
MKTLKGEEREQKLIVVDIFNKLITRTQVWGGYYSSYFTHEEIEDYMVLIFL